MRVHVRLDLVLEAVDDSPEAVRQAFIEYVGDNDIHQISEGVDLIDVLED